MPQLLLILFAVWSPIALATGTAPPTTYEDTSLPTSDTSGDLGTFETQSDQATISVAINTAPNIDLKEEVVESPAVQAEKATDEPRTETSDDTLPATNTDTAEELADQQTDKQIETPVTVTTPDSKADSQPVVDRKAAKQSAEIQQAPVADAESVAAAKDSAAKPPEDSDQPLVASPDQPAEVTSTEAMSEAAVQPESAPVEAPVELEFIHPSWMQDDAATGPLSTAAFGKIPNQSRTLLDTEIPPGTTTRLDWTPSRSFSGMAVDTPVLVVNGRWDGPTLCLTAAIHGDELNGIEMVRRVMYQLDAENLHGMVVGVPIVNLLGFTRNSRYLPDRRDLNRYFPGNARGSVASRLAHGFFQEIILNCNALVDLHTGSFYRTNITQLRADMSNPGVADFVALFGDIPVLSTRGNGNSLRAAAVRAGIPTVTMEAGEPMRMQVAVVEEGVQALTTLLEKNGMYPSLSLWSKPLQPGVIQGGIDALNSLLEKSGVDPDRSPWAKPSPAYYRSTWVRSNSSGILFSKVTLGQTVVTGDLLGVVINPVTNKKSKIVSLFQGRILGMALDQFVLPGFAAYHIGIRQPVVSKVDVTANVALRPTTDEEEIINGSQKNLPPELPIPLTPEEEGFDDE